MNDTTHTTLWELLPAYALGALDEEETYFVEDHLATYPDCVTELVALRDELTALAFSAPPSTPPPTAKAALFARIERATPPAREPAPTLQVRTAQDRLFARRWWRITTLALAAVLILGLLTWAVLAQSRLITEQRQLAAITQENQQLATQVSQFALVDKLLNDPNAAHPVSGPPADQYGLPAAGYVYTDPASTIGLLLTYWLPSITPDQRFQIWLITPAGTRDSGGLFAADARGNAQVLIRAPAPFSKYKSIGVTIEPASGSPGPTTPRVCGGEIR